MSDHLAPDPNGLGDCGCGTGHRWVDHRRNDRGDGFVCDDLRTSGGPSCPKCRVVAAQLDDPTTVVGAIRKVVFDHAYLYWVPGTAPWREVSTPDGERRDFAKIALIAGAWADMVAPRVAEAVQAVPFGDPTQGGDR